MKSVINKAYKVIVLTAIFLFSIATAFAQEIPCAGDPDDEDYDPNNCPLDTWVILLVAVVLILTFIHLHRRQKVAIRS
ncbi:hypothetical protein [Mucilaginibacter rubeus]|uniref:Signal peptidase n=1 Tax=Mucilaginibacter rubeus TaxID=2027860 RepID=A0A5C1HSH9_9SPHI|nr:hypothetical protein [Mucilaginibacter rubeus]QEM08947.1 hypothetical protein DEO27_002600 [Mucilaginibacter rubeus]